MVTDTIHRFDERAADYNRFRPSYPVEMISFFTSELGLNPGDVLVDVGAGTGKLTHLLLENGNQVYAVEPNDQMRAIADALLFHYEGYRSIPGTAESTNIPDNTADFVFTAQAFHWFDVERIREEFRRILKGKSLVVLIWNVRNTHDSVFLKEYDIILRTFSSEYAARERNKIEHNKIERVYGPQGYETAYFPHSQTLSEEGLIGRVVSNTYTPSPGDGNFKELLAAVRALYDEFQENGKVQIDYTTNVIYGAV